MRHRPAAYIYRPSEELRFGTQPFVITAGATGTACLPGSLPMIGSFPMGALPTTGCGGGGCGRGKSAAAAAPTKPIVALMVISIFNIMIPFRFHTSLTTCLFD